jgi:hypothetical protein
MTGTLKNVSNASMSVSATDIGNIEVAELTADDVPIIPITIAFSYLEIPQVLQRRAIRSLAPGESVTFDIDGLQIPNLKPGEKFVTRRYQAPHAGKYRLRLRYYADPAVVKRPGVFDRAVTSNEVTFALQSPGF